MTPYENLANAIVAQAVEDYRKALSRLVKYPYSKLALSQKHEVERFFRSDWYGMLTKLNPDVLINKFSAEVAE